MVTLLVKASEALYFKSKEMYGLLLVTIPKDCQALDDLKSRIANTNQKLSSQYRMMQTAHHRYNLLFRWTHEMLMIHHFALLLFKNYLTILVGMLQRIHHQYNRYESALDDTLIGTESLSSGYLTHHILDPKTLSR